MAETEHDDFLFLNEDETESEIQHTDFWNILIVDDDPEIHSVTQLALSGVLFWDKPLQFSHAYSGAEAIEFLSQKNDFAVVLLDVVMESDDAGLQAVRIIREQLKNHNIRIILRTGQPGYAPEEQVISEYDINDYKTKTELTRNKLVTSLVAALRSYEQLRQLEAQSAGLEKVISASKAILGLTDIEAFSNSVVMQLSELLASHGLGLVCGQRSQEQIVFGGSGEYQAYVGAGLEQVENGRAIHQIQNCFAQQQMQTTEFDITFMLNGGSNKTAVYIELAQIPTAAQLKLAEIFLTNVSVGFDNIKLLNGLRNAAFRDGLTGLSNRTDFVDIMGAFAGNSFPSYRLFLIDISQFSDINNGLGQDIGNLLLKSVVSRLKEDLPQAKLLSRIGADVFAIVIESTLLEPDELNDILNIPFRAGEHLLPINFTFGICEQQHFNVSGLKTLKSAYIALNLAKSSPQSNYEFYLPEMEEKMTWRLGIIRQLRQDFSDNKLQVWFQPQIDFNSLKMIGCEALLRWPTSDGLFISPAVFVPLAEDAGLIIDIGQWVLEQACIQQKHLESLGYHIRMAVNVSVPQFRDPNYIEIVKSTLAKYQVNPKYLELEVTESIVMDEPEVVINILSELKSLGVEVAIDDFGTGFSSLSYLQKLPLNRIKIDRAFVKDIPDLDSGAIAELIVSLGKKMNLKTIAEGIETQQQADFLIKAGCDEAQGFMYSKPLPADQLDEFAKKNS